LDIDWQYKLLAILFLFLLSAFFSGSEVALFSLDKKKIKNDLVKSPIISRYLFFLLEHPRRPLVTILIGNTIVNVGASIIAVSLAIEYAASSNISEEVLLTVQIIVLTILIIIFSELTPKVWAAKNSVRYAKIASIPLYWISVILFPIAETLTEIIKLSIAKLKFDRAKTAILPEEISQLTKLGHEIGTIEE
jgi:CBS domain containing-hemolysin-like protein